MGKLNKNRKPKHKKDWFNRESDVEKHFSKRKRLNDKDNL